MRTIFTLAKQINDHRLKMEALGMFVDDRELLECSSCNLVEDVTIEGVLITYDKNDNEMIDTGFRFENIENDLYLCPICGASLRAGEGE